MAEAPPSQLDEPVYISDDDDIPDSRCAVSSISRTRDSSSQKYHLSPFGVNFDATIQIQATPNLPNTPDYPYSSLLATTPEYVHPQIISIMCTVNLCCELDLKHITLNTRYSEYNPQKLSAVIMRIMAPRTTALAYSSGVMSFNGAKSEDQSKLSAKIFVRIIQKLGYPAEFNDFKIHNISANCDFKFPISLENLASGHGANSAYEPEIYCGLIYRLKNPHIVLQIYTSGKVVLTGAKVREELYEAIDQIYPILSTYRITAP